jgi:hypothetical protein
VELEIPFQLHIPPLNVHLVLFIMMKMKMKIRMMTSIGHVLFLCSIHVAL